MVSKGDYDKAVDEFVNSIRDRLGEKIVSIYAAGSYTRGDFIPGRSDIDIYVVTKVNEPNIEKELQLYVNDVVKKYLQDVKTVQTDVISIASTSLEDMKTGKSWLGIRWEYYVFTRESRLLYGEDIRPLIPRPSLQAIYASAQDVLKSMVFSRRKFVYYVFSMIFRMLAIFLSMREVYVAAKLDVLREFSRLYPDEKGAVSAVQRAYELWNVWRGRDLDDREISELIYYMLNIHGIINRIMSAMPKDIKR